MLSVAHVHVSARASVIERMKGVTLEFMAEENTLLQIEAVGDKVTKITKTKIVIEHKIRQNQYFSLHKVWCFYFFIMLMTLKFKYFARRADWTTCPYRCT